MEQSDGKRFPVAALHSLPALWPAVLLAAGILLENRFRPGLPLVLSIWLITVVALAVLAQFRAVMGPWQKTLSCAAILLTGSLLSLLYFNTLGIHKERITHGAGAVALSGYALGPSRAVQSAYGYPSRAEFDMQVRAEKRSGDNRWRRAGYRVGVRIQNPEGLALDGGENVVLAAELEPVYGYSNSGVFDWRAWRARGMFAGQAVVENGTHVRVAAREEFNFSGLLEYRRLAAMLHARLRSLHENLYPNPENRAVAGALLLGDRRGLDNTLEDWFIGSGTIHVLVVSGLHLGFIALVVYGLLALLLGRGFASAGVSCVVLLAYALATGGRPPMMRAWLIISFALFALPAGRQRHVLNSLAAAFAVLLMVNPSWLADPGFQLSFAAVGGIALVLPPVENRFNRRDWWSVRAWRWIFRVVVVSAVAQLAVGPLLAFHFHRFSPAAFVANPPVVALAGISVIGGFVADILGLVWLGAGQTAAWIVSWFITAMAATARWFAGFGWAMIDVPVPGIADLLFCWLLLWMGARLLEGRTRYLARILMVCLLWVNVTLWSPLIAGLGQRTEVTFLDLGESTAPLVRFPDRTILLADPGGRAPDSRWTAENIVAPYLRRQTGSRLDYLLVRGQGISRWNWVHAVLEQFRPRAVLVCAPEPFERATTGFVRYCQAHGIAVRAVSMNDTLNCGGAILYLNPETGIPEIGHGIHTLALAGESGLELTLIEQSATVIEWPEYPDSIQDMRTVVGPFGHEPDGVYPEGKVFSTREYGAVKISLDRDKLEASLTRREGR